MASHSGETERWIAIAHLTRTRGNRGELLAVPLSDRLERFQALKEVVLAAGNRRETREVESVWQHQDRLVFKLRGIDSITDAEAWAGAEVLIPRSERFVLPEGEYYYTDLVGCRVVNRSSGKWIGDVTGVEEYGGPVLLAVSPAGGGEKFLVPFARSICPEIDVPGRLIRVDLPEGLQNLEEAEEAGGKED